ncbi:bifunctional diaminohydroxyphosphoribosylaminopyrimidine deaminase/5-amino-6-(5-phosphoribosylamino)uracil reductase RibD [Bacteroidota bacterium]
MINKEIYVKYIKQCLKLAQKGIGKVSPNPLVGCVIVKENNVIGQGWHAEYGGVHAEVNAIRNSTESLNGSALYCNLEPCCHTDKNTPPCTPEIIKNGITNVVISNIDPNPSVSGKGIKELKKAGINVITNVMEEEGRELNRFYFKFTTNKIPYVTLKVAQTLDGKITKTLSEQTWISSDTSITDVHKQRNLFDAVLIGANTLKIDDPLLNVRNISGKNPIRIILDGKLSSPISSKIFNLQDSKNTWIITDKYSNSNKKKKLIDKGINIIEFPVQGNKEVDLKKLVKYLGKKRITSLLVEGGNKIFSQFVNYQIFDEIIIFTAPKIFGKGLSSFSLNKEIELKLNSVRRIGRDIKITLRRIM